MGLSYITISATTLYIMWNSPEVTNGEIQMYSVLVEAGTSSVFQKNVLEEQVTVTNLSEIDSVFV